MVRRLSLKGSPQGSRFRAEPMAFGWGQKLVYEDVGIRQYDHTGRACRTLLHSCLQPGPCTELAYFEALHRHYPS